MRGSIVVHWIFHDASLTGIWLSSHRRTGFPDGVTRSDVGIWVVSWTMFFCVPSGDATKRFARCMSPIRSAIRITHSIIAMVVSAVMIGGVGCKEDDDVRCFVTMSEQCMQIKLIVA